MTSEAVQTAVADMTFLMQQLHRLSYKDARTLVDGGRREERLSHRDARDHSPGVSVSHHFVRGDAKVTEVH